jgi:TolB-like protein
MLNDGTRLCAKNNGDFYGCSDLSAPASRATADPTLFQTPLHFQLLSEYTEQMAADLNKDLYNVPIRDAIAVASFVYFDSTLQRTSTLGNQLAEFFINDLQNIGLPVTDQKLSSNIVVNGAGDFALSRNMQEMNLGDDIGYVLVGIMIENPRGLILNVRLLDAETSRVVASTSKLLPGIIFAGG